MLMFHPRMRREEPGLIGHFFRTVMIYRVSYIDLDNGVILPRNRARK